MNKEELKVFIEKLFGECEELLMKKSSDYADDSNVFENLSMIEQYKVGTIEQAIFTKLSDKLSRIASYIRKGTYNVQDESFQDSIKDGINYLLLLAANDSKKKTVVFVENSSKIKVNGDTW